MPIESPTLYLPEKERISPAENHDVLLAHDYITDVVEEIHGAMSAQRPEDPRPLVVAKSMYALPGVAVNPLFDAMSQAATGPNPAEAHLYIDSFTKLMIHKGIPNYVFETLGQIPPINVSGYQETKRQLYEFEETMIENGVNLHFTNPPQGFDHLLPTMNRDHIKGAAVITKDRAVGYLGGVNLHDANITDSTDVMIKLTDRETVLTLATILMQAEELTNDMVIPLPDGSSFVYDAGKDRSSAIIDNAVDMINSAQRLVRFTSPIAPDAEFRNALYNARKRDVDVLGIAPKFEPRTSYMDYTNGYNKLVAPFSGEWVQVLEFPGSIHAKTIMADDEVMITSNNFTRHGTNMKTRELGYRTRDPKAVGNVRRFHAYCVRKINQAA